MRQSFDARPYAGIYLLQPFVADLLAQSDGTLGIDRVDDRRGIAKAWINLIDNGA
ncbi:hypothetical protein QEV83_10910 [Methylocapsa sp. D3K7]|uniref:hypothetical protein n=1 Tax=Methylocapsa sp. D3K7 TaxID=3041435 RepID=UPI00244E689B|nr:hypothetical protein [Methylocapsa sp. D3K7]WGJ13226.1 hypothetical protein QEV83_10910 [Methylocapsa sp. D3K7]